MTDSPWLQLLRVHDGEILDPLPIGFIADCPRVTPRATCRLAWFGN